MKKTLIVAWSLLALTGAQAQLLWFDSMSYPTGNITNNTALWITHSGTAKDALVVNYPGSAASQAGTRLEVNQGRADDIHRWFYPADTNGISTVYLSFIVSVTNLPANAGGAYFAHLMDKSTMFRGRLFATVPANPYPYTTTVPGVFRFGTANNQGDYSSATPTTTGPSVVMPVDLALNTDYLVVMKYDTFNAAATLWVNPATEFDPSVTTSDFGSVTNPLVAFAFRQAAGEGILDIRNLAAGLAFTDVVTNTPATPVIGLQPVGVTNYSGNPAILEVAASGLGLSYQWKKGGSDVGGATKQALVFDSLQAGDTGDYYCSVSTTGGSVDSATVHVAVTTTPTPPIISTQPKSVTNSVATTATFSVVASGTGPLSYRWNLNGTPLSDSTTVVGSDTPTLTISNITTNDAGAYTVTISGGAGSPVTSAGAKLTVALPPPVSIAFLRTLVNTNTWQATNTTSLFNITGVITVLTNQSSGQSSFYIQDSTAGINLFVTGITTFRPQIGDIVTASGSLSSFNNNLELVCVPSNPAHSYTVVGHQDVLPAPVVFSPLLTNNSPAMEALEGSVVMLTNVYFPSGASAVANTTVTVTNAGTTFWVFFPAGQDQDVRNRAYPSFAWTVTGVLNQYKSSAYSQAGYEVNVTRWADVVTSAPAPANVSATRTGNNVTLTWAAVPYATSSAGAYCYSVLAAPTPSGPYSPLATGLTFTNTVGTYTDTTASGAMFYRISTP